MLLKEIQSLKTDLLDLQKNSNVLLGRIDEEKLYISKIKQLEDEVRREVSNQKVLKIITHVEIY